MTTSKPAKPTAAIVAMAYSAVADPDSDFKLRNIFFTSQFTDKLDDFAEGEEICE